MELFEPGHYSVCGHPRRLARFETTVPRFENKAGYCKKELIAEVTAALLCHVAGVDSEVSIKNSAAYIAGCSRFTKDNSDLLWQRSTKPVKPRLLFWALGNSVYKTISRARQQLEDIRSMTNYTAGMNQVLDTHQALKELIREGLAEGQAGVVVTTYASHGRNACCSGGDPGELASFCRRINHVPQHPSFCDTWPLFFAIGILRAINVG